MHPSTSIQERSAPSAPPHPELNTWIAYHGGELPEVEERRLRNHLASCRRCVQLLLDLAAFVSRERAGDETAADFEKAATWRLVRAHALRRPRRRPGWPAAVAAVLLGMLGLSGWTVVHQQSELRELRGTVTTLSGPQANAPIFDLRPGGSLRSRQGHAQRLTVPRGSGFTLILNLIESGSAPTYQARIVDAERTAVATVRGLELDALDTLTFLVPAGRLPPGRYTVELRDGADQGTAPPLESYSIEIARP